MENRDVDYLTFGQITDAHGNRKDASSGDFRISQLATAQALYANHPELLPAGISPHDINALLIHWGNNFAATFSGLCRRRNGIALRDAQKIIPALLVNEGFRRDLAAHRHYINHALAYGEHINSLIRPTVEFWIRRARKQLFPMNEHGEMQVPADSQFDIGDEAAASTIFVTDPVETSFATDVVQEQLHLVFPYVVGEMINDVARRVYTVILRSNQPRQDYYEDVAAA